MFVVAGSKNMMGAAVLSSLGAMRGGAGLVRLGIVESRQRIAAMRAPLEVTTMGLPEDKKGLLSSSALRVIRKAITEFKTDVVAVGPGLGQSPVVKKIVREFLFRDSRPVVLDADGINALADLNIQKKPRAPLIITPHAGEMARLLNTSIRRVMADRVQIAKAAAKKFGCVCLLKGPGTIVTDGKEVFRNTTGNPGMASGGMGDILTGLIAAIWGQMEKRGVKTGLQAAAIAAFVHGRAADLAVRKFSERGLLASDVAAFFPQAFRNL